jgi:AraC-like DNA-binding protein
MKPDAKKYTIEYVSETVGYKSRTSFYSAFKEVTGISPNFYFKSIQEQKREE